MSFKNRLRRLEWQGYESGGQGVKWICYDPDAAEHALAAWAAFREKLEATAPAARYDYHAPITENEFVHWPAEDEAAAIEAIRLQDFHRAVDDLFSLVEKAAAAMGGYHPDLCDIIR